MKLKDLIEKRKALLEKADAILNKAEAEKRDLSKEENEQHAQFLNDVESLDGQIATAKKSAELRSKQDSLEKEVRSLPTPRALADPAKDGPSEKEERDLEKYSISRAFNKLLDGERLDGIEREMHDEAAAELRDAGVQRNGGNFLIPQRILTFQRKANNAWQRRDMTATGTTSVAGDQGGMAIQTTVQSLIGRVRQRLVLDRLGVTMLGGLVGNVSFPKFGADDQAAEKAENAASNESSGSLSQFTMSPRRLPVHTEVSRQLLLQQSAISDAFLEDDLSYQIAKVLNQRSINGSGSSNQPYGILNASGVGSVALGTNGGAPTFDLLVDLETAIGDADLDEGALGYLTNAKVKGKLKKTPIESGTSSDKIWDRLNSANPLNGYRAETTTLVPKNLTKGTASGVCSAMIFGDFSQALMGQWGGIEFLINPYSRDTEGLIRINAWTWYDFALRRPEAFAVCKDILTT